MTLSPTWQEPAHLDVRPANVTGFRLVDEILARRGFVSMDEANHWLHPNLEQEAERAVVPGLVEVVERIQRAVEAGERIVIFGDYDCDGITSTAILFSALRWASTEPSRVAWRLPARTEGYGLIESQVAPITEDGPGLLIAVDCGSNDVDAVAAVRTAGMDVVVIDHHQISASLPVDVPFANPQRDQVAGSTEMTAAGLSWLTVRKLAQLGVRVGPNGEGAARYLDLAAIGTVGDVATLTGINRALVSEGLERIRMTRRPGLRALARVARFDLASLTAEAIPFDITPRLNAPGRMSSPDIALTLLLASDWDTAQEAAIELVAVDKTRKATGDKIFAEALALLDGAERLDNVLVVDGQGWHGGLLGPVATRLAERFGRPTIVVGGEGDALTGSGRSVGGWDMAAAFRHVSAYLERHGGHSGAAGLTVARERVSEFRHAINGYMADTGIVTADPTLIEIEADIGDDNVNYGLVKAMESMAPFGRGNPRPVLRWTGVQAMDLRAVGKGGSTGQLLLRRGSSQVNCVMFGGIERLSVLEPGQLLDVVLTLGLESWNGRTSVKGRILDFQLSS